MRGCIVFICSLKVSYGCSEIVRYYWGGEDLLSFALRAMNAAQMLLPGHPLSEQSWHSYALVSELLMGTAFTGLQCLPVIVACSSWVYDSNRR